MKCAGGTSSARRWSRFAALGIIVFATSALAAGQESTAVKPAGSAASHTTSVAAGSAAAVPAPPPGGQPGLYENESIRRTPASGSSSNAGVGTTTSATNGAWSLSRVPAALAAVLIVIFGIRWVMGKMSGGAGRGRSTRAMHVVARSPVSPRQQLLLIQIGKRLVLVGNSGGAMNPLCQIDDPTEVASLLGQIRSEQASTPVSSFKSFFGRANTDYEMPPAQSMFKPREPASGPDDREQDEEPRERSVAADLLDHREMRDEVELSGSKVASQASPPTIVEESGVNSGADAADPAVAATRGELSELMAKVRRMSQGFPR